MHLRPKRQLVKGEHCSVLSGSSRHVHVCAAQVGQCLQCTGKGTASVSAAMENSGHDSPRQCTRSKFGERELADFHTTPHTHTHTRLTLSLRYAVQSERETKCSNERTIEGFRHYVAA